MNWDSIYRQTKLHDLPWYPGDIDDLLRDAIYSGWLRGRAALDVGAGQGTDAIYLAANGYQVTCLDVSPAARELALKEAERAHVEIDYVIGDALAMPFDDNQFDLVFDRGCFEHLSARDQQQYVAEVIRVLKQGGTYFYRSAPAAAGAAERQASLEAVIAAFGSTFTVVESGTYLAKGLGGRAATEHVWVILKQT